MKKIFMKLFAMLGQTQRTAPMKLEYLNILSTNSTQLARASPSRVTKDVLVFLSSSSITAKAASISMRSKVQWAQALHATKLEDIFLTLLVLVSLSSSISLLICLLELPISSMELVLVQLSTNRRIQP